MSDLEKYADKLEIKKIIITMILTALGFVVAFQWRDVIKETIEVFLPPGEGLGWKWIGALAFTIIGAVLAIVLVKIQKMNLVPDKWEPQKRLASELRKRKKRRK